MRPLRPADILIPQNVDMSAWSVVACDQFTSEPEYWQEVEKLVGDKPSALRMILPEAYLGKKDAGAESRISAAMKKYLKDVIFAAYENSYVYVERTLAGGKLRRGFIGALDLDEYDSSPDSSSPIRATEGTVEDRLPPRVKVRMSAELEMPHIMVFIDDPGDTVMKAAAGGRELYNFDLMQNGGHIAGFLAPDNAAVDAAVDALSQPEILDKKYGKTGKAPVIFAMGDGNHSLAAAKKCWEQIKPTLSEIERENHPARFALAEIVNIHDEAISFEPIHKVLFNTSITRDFIPAGKMYFKGTEGFGHVIRFIAGDKSESISVKGLTIGELIDSCERFISRYQVLNGGKLDYIHGDAEAAKMASGENCCGILLPKMSKDELFSSVIKSGPFPKKSFSIGVGPDKRYYLECRKIK